MSGVDVGRVNLIVATLNLKMVRLIRDAIRTADAAAVLPGERVLSRELARRIDVPERRFLPRPVIHPTPYFAPRPVIHLRPRVEEQPPVCPPREPLKCLPKKPAALQPPWAVVPWEKPIQPAPKVKINIRRTDVISKGSLLDFFI